MAKMPAGFRKVKEKEPEGRWFDRPRALLEGATIGLADEVGALAGAGMAKVDQLVTGRNKDQSFGDIYREMHGQFQDESDAYEKARPKEAIALNLIGGLTTGGVGLGKSAMRAGTPFLKRALAATGAGAVEGGIAGAASADQGFENRVKGGVIGAAIGAGTGGALSTLGGGANAVAKRRIAQELGEGDNFIPLNLAAPETPMGHLYKDLVGRTWGGAETLKNQTMRVAAPVVRRFKNLQEKAGALPGTLTHAVTQGKEEAKKLFDAAMREGTENLDNQSSKLLETIGRKTADEKRVIASSLRQLAKQEAMSPNMPPKVREAVMRAPTKEANDLLKGWYSDEGFKIVKNRVFQWDDNLKKSFEEMVSNDPDLALELGDVWAKIPGKPAGNQIGGDQLMAIRNTFARRAADGAKSNSSNAAFSANALNQVKKRFDKMITSQLGDDAAKYADELKTYGAAVQFDRATQKAVGKRQGEFLPDDWMQSLPKKKAARNKGLLQAEAEQGQFAGAALREAEKKAVKKAGKGLAKAKAALREEQAKKLAQAERRVPIKVGVERKKAEMGSKLAKAKAQLEEIRKYSPPEAASGLSQVLSTEYLAPPLNLPGNAGVALLTGTQTGRLLAKEGTQRFLAGQTGFQKALARDLRMTEKEREILSRALRRGMVQQSTQED